MERGLHRSKKMEDLNKYEYCLRCHSPHYESGMSENRTGRFDNTRPHYEQCGACHEERSRLPSLSPEDEGCMNCHRLSDPDDPLKHEKIARLCFHCHGQTGTEAQHVTGEIIPLINEEEYESTPRTSISCTMCHPQAPGFMHGAQKLKSRVIVVNAISPTTKRWPMMPMKRLPVKHVILRIFPQSEILNQRLLSG